MKKYRYKKSFRTKKKKSVFNIFKNKFFWLGVLVLGVLSGLAYVFIFSSVFQIKEIQISGAEKVPVEEIGQIISDNSNNIFLANFGKINKIILEKYLQIGKINLERKLPDILLAEVEERKPVAVFCNQDCFFIDKEGVSFERVSEIPPEMLIVKIEGLSSSEGAKLLKIDQVLKIKSIQGISIEEISLISNTRFNAKTTEGWEIYFNPEENLDWQLRELDLILKQKLPPEKRGNLQYIDLRFNRVFIYPEIF